MPPTVATESSEQPTHLRQLERDKERQKQLSELSDVAARYRGPLLEAAIDLEQALWHVVRAGPGRGPGRAAAGRVGACKWAQLRAPCCVLGSALSWSR